MKRKIFFCEYNYFNYHTKARRKNVDSYTFLGILIRFSYDYFKNVCFANLRKMEKCETEMKILPIWQLGVCLYITRATFFRLKWEMTVIPTPKDTTFVYTDALFIWTNLLNFKRFLFLYTQKWRLSFVDNRRFFMIAH